MTQSGKIPTNSIEVGGRETYTVETAVITPGQLVKFGSDEDNVVVATDESETVVGVAQAITKSEDTTYAVGGEITIIPRGEGRKVVVVASDAVAIGNILTAAATGKAKAISTTVVTKATPQIGFALTAAADGEKFIMMLI